MGEPMAEHESAASTGSSPADGTGLVQHDPWLGPYADALRRRYQLYQEKRQRIIDAEGSLERFARGHRVLRPESGGTRRAIGGVVPRMGAQGNRRGAQSATSTTGTEWRTRCSPTNMACGAGFSPTPSSPSG